MQRLEPNIQMQQQSVAADASAAGVSWQVQHRDLNSLVIIGPVIGQVSQSEVKILVETQFSADLEMRLTPADLLLQSLPKKSQTATFEAKRPLALHFKDLQPDTRYRVELYHQGVLLNGRVGSFRTMPTTASRTINIACCSCNRVPPTPGEGQEAWQELHARVMDGQVDMIVHMGDQVYADDGFRKGAWKKARDTWLAYAAQHQANGQNIPEDHEIPLDLKQHLLDIFCDVYRQTWGWQRQFVANTLANTANITILDDHELRDDWGSNQKEDDGDMPVARIGREAYWMYQRQLRFGEDYYASRDQWMNSLIHEGYRVQLFDGPSAVSVLVVDMRCGHSFGRHIKQREGQKLPSQQPFLSIEQYNEVREFITDFGGSTMIVVLSVPITFSSPMFMNQLAKLEKLNDLRDSFQAGGNLYSMVDLFDLLKCWKDARPGRVVQFIGGDIHIGGKSQIVLDDAEAKPREYLLGEQLVSSPIGTKPPRKILMKAYVYFMRVGFHLAYSKRYHGKYRIHHNASSYMNIRNFGLLHIDSTAEAARISTELVGVKLQGAKRAIVVK